MKHKIKLSLVLALALGVTPVLSSVNQSKTYAKENIGKLGASQRSYEQFKYSIAGGPPIPVGGREVVKMLLKKRSIQNIESAMTSMDYIVKNNNPGIINVTKYGYVSYTPCSSCRYPSLGMSNIDINNYGK